MKASHVTSVDALAAPDSEPPMLPGEIVMEMSPKRPGGVKSRHVRSLASGASSPGRRRGVVGRVGRSRSGDEVFFGSSECY